MDRGQRTLLLVDSSATYLFYMAMLLKRLEYTVRTATSAELALKTMAESFPALVITDTALPGMSGLDLLKDMRRDSRLKAIPVIFHSSENDPTTEKACTTAGCAAYLQKPAEPDALYKAIQTVIEATPRKHIRIVTFLRVEVGDGIALDGKTRMEYATALSEGGLYVKTLFPEPVNTVIPVKIFFRDRALEATASVQYSSVKVGGQHKEPGMGLRFVEISPEDKAYVRKYIKDEIARGLSF